jgi:hypothetical protein
VAVPNLQACRSADTHRRLEIHRNFQSKIALHMSEGHHRVKVLAIVFCTSRWAEELIESAEQINLQRGRWLRGSEHALKAGT